MLGFLNFKANPFPRLFPRFGFDTPLFRLIEFYCFQTGNFFSAWDTVWSPARQAPDFSAPPLRGFAHAPVPGLLLQSFSPWLLVDRFHAAPYPRQSRRSRIVTLLDKAMRLIPLPRRANSCRQDQESSHPDSPQMLAIVCRA